MTRPALSLLLCAALAGCATAPVASVPAIVQPSLVPIAEPCAIDPGPKPAFADPSAAIAAAPNIYERAKLYAAGRQQRLAWEARLEAANAGCRAAGRGEGGEGPSPHGL